ncbi:nuclear transport factor 2 family protein [Thalassotalea sediminis]|uniref:nuclear transport factor 2 family protein n=1 Tax=Thalassotalea sediminis TaxID=1759089 RepID=UPI002573FE62|nr:nuclear transport factor 2 family protein [Thalassotalea sediminis]
MDHISAIRQQIDKYFDGLYHADVSLLMQVFHPNARYTSTTDGELIHLSMPAYFENVENRQAPSSKGQVRQDRVLTIDVIGNYTALAKVQCVIAPKYFTDFLSFIYLDNKWQIISKVFHYQLTPFK